MRVKAESCVFFVSGMAADEEYELVTRQQQRPARRPSGRLNGSGLLLTGQKLLPKREIGVVDLEYAELDEKMFNLLACLTRLPPFYNFVLNFKEKRQDAGGCAVMDRICGFLDLVVEGRKSNVSDLLMELDAREYGDAYSELVRAIHDELCESYNFEEDAWSTMDKGQGPKPKLLYRDYSPVVEIFQGKAVSGGQLQEVSFEKAKVSLKGFSSVQEAFDSHLEAEGKRITKMPAVLVIVVEGQGSTGLLSKGDIRVEGSAFSLCSFIAEQGSASHCYVRSGGRWYGYEDDGVREVSRMNGVRGNPAMLFYAREE